jgi:two-component system, NarL family, sensor histidine kinase UhpB
MNQQQRIRPDRNEAPASGGAARRSGLVSRFLGVRLFYKILIANATIVASVAAAFVVFAGRAPAAELAFGVAALGITLTIALNAAILRLALRPVAELQQAAERVAHGDVTARVPESALADADLRRLATTFNAMLDADAERRAKVRELAVSALGAAEEERRRIARELHDGIAQQLAALQIQLRVVRNVRGEDDRDALLVEVGQELGRQIDELRTMAVGLRPPALDMLGLAPAVETLARQLADRTGVRIRAKTEPIGGLLDPTAELAMYRILQEALGNAAKHAAARSVELELARSDGHVVGVVRDDGRGFSVVEALAGSAVGLYGMKERASYVGGRVDIASEPGGGTRVLVSIPVAEAGSS